MLREWKVIAARRMQDAGMTVVETARVLQISDRSVRKYRDMEEFPDEQDPAQQKSSARNYRTREDPLAVFWPEIAERLEGEPRLKPFMILNWLSEKYPDQISPSVRRSLERRIQKWRQEREVQKEAMFSQFHHPGDVIAFDFVDLRELGVTIQSRPYPHLMFHAVLTCSNWEYIHLCQSESFEAVSRGLQDALMWAGGVPRRVRSDSLTAAVNNLSADHEFQPQYQQLLSHYGLEGHRINVRKPHENGDVESSHGHLKMWLDQSLLLRAHRNFESVEAYRRWSREVVEKKNQTRRLAVQKEQECLRPLPMQRLDCFTRIDQKVSKESLIQVRQNTYSVNSKYIGLKLQIRIQQDDVELWYAGRHVETMPRLFGKGKESIDYRHIIDSLIRKPGAFRNYRYMQHLFPTIRFRMAWDQLDVRLSERAAVKEYLRLLYDAKYEGEDRVDAALRQLLDANQEISANAVKAIITANVEVPLPTDVNVELPDLSDYETLCYETLCYKDVPDEETTSVPIEDNEVGDSVVITSEPAVRCESASSEPAVSDEFTASDRHSETGGTTEGTATADDSGTPSADGRSCGSGTLDAHSLSGRADGSGMSGTDTDSSGPTAAECASAPGQDMESVSVVSAAAADRETVRDASSRELPRSADQHSGLWQTRFGEDKFTLCAGGRTRPSGPVRMLHDLPVAGAGVIESETRSETGSNDQVSGQVRGFDHRRSGLRSTEPRRDGSAVHTAGGTLRTRQCPAEQQSAVQQVGADLQRPNDHCGCDRSPGSSFCGDRTQHPQLPSRSRQTESKDQSRFVQFKNQIEQLILTASQTDFLIVANPQT
jgi:transposase